MQCLEVLHGTIIVINAKQKIKECYVPATEMDLWRTSLKVDSNTIVAGYTRQSKKYHHMWLIEKEKYYVPTKLSVILQI